MRLVWVLLALVVAVAAQGSWKVGVGARALTPLVREDGGSVPDEAEYSCAGERGE